MRCNSKSKLKDVKKFLADSASTVQFEFFRFDAADSSGGVNDGDDEIEDFDFGEHVAATEALATENDVTGSDPAGTRALQAAGGSAPTSSAPINCVLLVGLGTCLLMCQVHFSTVWAAMVVTRYSAVVGHPTSQAAQQAALQAVRLCLLFGLRRRG